MFNNHIDFISFKKADFDSVAPIKYLISLYLKMYLPSRYMRLIISIIV